MPTVTSNTDAAADEIVGEPTIAGIWFLTQRSPWYTNFVGTGTILDVALLLLLAPFIAYEHFRPARRTEAETLLDHSGPIYCARTSDDLVFIASNKTKGARRTYARAAPISAVDITFLQLSALPFNRGRIPVRFW